MWLEADSSRVCVAMEKQIMFRGNENENENENGNENKNRNENWVEIGIGIWTWIGNTKEGVTL